MTKPTYRCSALPRIFGCNGSLSITHLVDPRDGDEGFEGVMLHWMIADRLIRDHGAIPPEGGLPPPEVPDGYKLPAFSAWIVDWAVRHVLETVPPDWSIQVEVELAEEFGAFGLTGHADILAISPDGKRAKGKDWKSGIKFIEPAESNEQVNGYVVLFKQEWPGLEEIEFEICQPRADEDAGIPRVSGVTVSGDTLNRLAPTLERRMNEAFANRMELNTGPIQCAYCIGCSCPAIRELEKHMKLTLTPEMIDAIERTPNDALLGDFVVDAKTLAKPIEDAKELIRERLKVKGTITAGCGTIIGLKESAGSIKVTNPKGAWDAVRSMVPEEKLPEVLKYSKERLIDVVAEERKIPKGGKAAVTGESLYKALFMPNAEQSTKATLTFQ